MQYLLSKEEYDDLLNSHDVEVSELKNTIQELCIFAATNKPIISNDGSLKPHGCIKSKDKNTWCSYCDNCPVESVCPEKYKEWSR